MLHARSDDVADLLARLKPLRKLRWTVEPMVELEDEGDEAAPGGRKGVCPDFLVGRACTHPSPCK